jgi:hypothetical protein
LSADLSLLPPPILDDIFLVWLIYFWSSLINLYCQCFPNDETILSKIKIKILKLLGKNLKIKKPKGGKFKIIFFKENHFYKKKF